MVFAGMVAMITLLTICSDRSFYRWLSLLQPLHYPVLYNNHLIYEIDWCPLHYVYGDKLFKVSLSDSAKGQLQKGAVLALYQSNLTTASLLSHVVYI